VVHEDAGHGCSTCRDSTRQERVSCVQRTIIKVQTLVVASMTLKPWYGRFLCKHLIDPNHHTRLLVCILGLCLLNEVVHPHSHVEVLSSGLIGGLVSDRQVYTGETLTGVLCKKVQQVVTPKQSTNEPNAAAIADQRAEATDWHFREREKKRFRLRSSSTRAWLLGPR
jgi:hypothetical protein